jgi:hypothetical protein
MHKKGVALPLLTPAVIIIRPSLFSTVFSGYNREELQY